MKLIFTDIDGVYNGCYTKARAPSGCIGVEQEKLSLLKEIVDATNAKIVLTSTWKTEWFCTSFKEDLPKDGAYLEREFAKQGLHIWRKTDDPSWAQRGQGILNFLSEFKDTIESYVILDDETFDFIELGIDDKLIKTRYSPKNLDFEGIYGLQPIHVEKAINILGRI